MEIGALSESFYCKAIYDDLEGELKMKGEEILSKRRNMHMRRELKYIDTK